MRLIVAAVGKLGRSPEQEAAQRLSERINGLARSVRLGPLTLVEVEDKSRRGATAEAALLRRAGAAERRIALDERGQTLSSIKFARCLTDWRDTGVSSASFLIGGADGHDPALRNEADLVLSLGEMTWPHALARLMLIEQLYRAATIAAGHPYHREG